MKNKAVFLLFMMFALLPGCKKASVEIQEWAQFQDPIFKVSFNYPKDWIVSTDPAKVVISSSAESAEKFFDHDARKADGVQITIASERSDSMQDYVKYMQDFKSNKTAEGFTVGEVEDAKIDGLPAKTVTFSGAYDENTKIKAVCVATLKDSTIYTVQYAAFNKLFDAYQMAYDSVMSSLMLPKKIVVEKGVNPAIPSSQIERYSDAYVQLERPLNFGSTDLQKKGDVMSAVQFMGVDKASRNDCTIAIDVRPAKKLTLDKVVEQNAKLFKVQSRGTATISGEKSTFLNYSPLKNVESRVYFIVKNDRIYRIILNYYAPMRKDFLPPFEKVVASIRLK